MEDPGGTSELAKAMALLAHPVRLSLLNQLRYPRTVAQLNARTPSKYGEARAERSVSRQAIRQHLAKLVEGGLVRTVGERNPTYVVDQPKTYALAQHLLLLSSQFEADVVEPGTTMVWQSKGKGRHAATGPRLILVHGAYEGRTYALDGKKEHWTIGRSSSQDLALDYDPFVSREHAAVTGTRGHHVLHDLGTNPERLQVNGVSVDAGGHTRLQHGDIIRIGRSVLVYHARG